MRTPKRAHRFTLEHKPLHAGASPCVPPDKLSGETLTTPLPKIKVMIVHQACWTRRAMRDLIDESERFAVCAETDNARNAITLFERHQPKIVVLGLVLAHGNALQLMKTLLKLAPAVLVLVLSWEESAMSICRALRAGAIGYLTVKDGDLELLLALDTITTGACYVSKSLWTVVLKSFAHSALAQVKAGTNLLTDRELEVFTLIGRGTGTLEMAEQLGLSIKTVETHQMRIKQKLNLANAAQLRKYAVRSMSKQRA
jgi:DNA-binding NarL/FixJ family response regulator